jgi:aminoglycoside phosphotransferase (APT) family kinase protein
MVQLHHINMKITPDIAKDIAKHHFGMTPEGVRELTGGHTNFTYQVVIDDEKYIIRIADDPVKIQYFQKEQWAVQRAQEKRVPVPEILEVGNEAASFPYMIVRWVDGEHASIYPDRLKVVEEMGKWASVINSIPTVGFGHVFDWSSNRLSFKETWKDYLEKEMEVDKRLELFERHKIFEDGQLSRLRSALKEMSDWNHKPTLTHGDMRLKNVLVNDKGKITAILDWETCTSNIAPYWDISVALHDLAIDEKEAFLTGYGMTLTEYRKIAREVKAINIINYAPFVEMAYEDKEKKFLESFKTRLRGMFDLYTL